MSDSDPTFPTPSPDPAPPWQWPLPPALARRFSALAAAPQPCLIETQTGLKLRGAMLDFDPFKRRLQFCPGSGGTQASLPFAGVRRLTLTAPLASDRPAATAPKERDYTLQLVGNAAAVALTGRSAGHVQATEGLYLFSPAEDEGGLCRVFVPRTAYSRCEFGPSAEELAARHWIASPAKLVQAIAQQQRSTVLPLGQALLALGLLTQAQLSRVLQRAGGKTALGEALVDGGLVSRGDLQTALAHTMGFPLVDLERFPLDPHAMALLPGSLAISHRVLPLMLDGERLIVAVDRPGRVLKLCRLPAYAQLPIVPVLALKSKILLALDPQASSAWSADVSQMAGLSSPES